MYLTKKVKTDRTSQRRQGEGDLSKKMIIHLKLISIKITKLNAKVTHFSINVTKLTHDIETKTNDPTS